MKRQYKAKPVGGEGQRWAEGNLVEQGGRLLIYGLGLWTEVQPETVRQGTGVDDRHGLEIYEGDLLRSESFPFYSEGKFRYYGLVEWDRGVASYRVKLVRATRQASRALLGLSYQLRKGAFEVIGNMWDNKNLMSDDG